VVWAIDGDNVRLRPSLSYGYPDKVLAKLRPLQIDADNVTSLAFRSLQPQMMNGASMTDSAALAIPLADRRGCVGVLAVELRHNRPHADLLAVARILGAQFSTTDHARRRPRPHRIVVLSPSSIVDRSGRRTMDRTMDDPTMDRMRCHPVRTTVS
jgi:hypothetical protein